MKVRSARKRKGLTLCAAAKKLGTDAGNLSRVERGVQNPGIDLARRIAALYGLSLDDVFASREHGAAA